MKTYIVTTGLILKYPCVFGIDPEEWKSRLPDEQWVLARETPLPPEVAKEAVEVDSYVVDEETGLRYEPTLFDFDHLGKFSG